MKNLRPLESKDVVRIKHGLPGKTGVVNRIDGENANIFVTQNNPTQNNPTQNNPTQNNPTQNNPTQNNPSQIGIWYNLRELKRIGRVK